MFNEIVRDIKGARGRQDRDEELCWRLEVNGEILFFKKKETNFWCVQTIHPAIGKQ